MLLEEWIEENRLNVHFIFNDKRIFTIPDVGKFLHIEFKDGLIFDDSLNLLVSEEEYVLSSKHKIDYFVYQFGCNYFYTPAVDDIIYKPKLNVFKYLGSVSIIEDLAGIDYPFLGIHGAYELMNGSKYYNDWCKKAKFLGVNTLGICERETLAGALAFQLACKESNIKPIFGMSIGLTYNFNVYDCKLYVANEEGWSSLLAINKYINVDQEAFTLDVLMKHGNGIMCVIPTNFPIDLSHKELIKLKKSVKGLYYQIDFVEWKSDAKDTEHLLNIQKYLKKYVDIIPPLLINDAYYLDKTDAEIKVILNTLGNVNHQHDSNDQYFKDIYDNYKQIESLFDDEQLIWMLDKCLTNLQEFNDTCDFKIEVGNTYLPDFEREGISNKYKNVKSNKDLFLQLINEGLDKKIDKRYHKQYIERIEIEVDLIERGKFIDYFLILWDIVRWCKENNILVGIGRGSAGGSLVAYLLSITKLDPLEYGLLFERFLNAGRLGKGMSPDIDLDFQGDRRDEVKAYMESKYGINYVCSVGVYTTFAIKAAIQDVGRYYNIPPQLRNYMTAILDLKKGTWDEIFYNAIDIKKPQLKKFVLENPELINTIPLILDLPKSASVHACATLILPKYKNDKKIDIYEWLPLRKIDKGMNVSQWEGEYTEMAGFLKEDILGIKQLDKIQYIFDSVKRIENIELDLESIPLDTKGVYKLFKDGFTEDSFHFGSPGLQQYSRQVQPDNIEDLIAMISLYRPGAMDSFSHEIYIKRKNGEDVDFEYDYMLEEVTKETYGIFIYQEQVMKACQILGGFSLVETDSIRKAMGKKDPVLLESYKKQFIKGAVDNKCDELEAEVIWDKLVVFAGYGFNRSHAAAYAITGYISMYLKYKYPIHFWLSAFQFGDEKSLSKYVNEINKSDLDVELITPDINKSQFEIIGDFEENKIYWSLLKVKGAGEVACKTILEERSKNGDFYTITEFYKRVPRSKVKKNIVTALILSGCFDEMYEVNDSSKRLDIIKEFLYASGNEKDFDEYIGWPYHMWTLKQRELCGLGIMDYEVLMAKAEYPYLDNYVDSTKLEIVDEKYISIGGIITSIKEKSYSKGVMGQITLQSNDVPLSIAVWNEQWNPQLRDELKNNIGNILFINGERKYNDKMHKVQIQTNNNTEFYLF